MTEKRRKQIVYAVFVLAVVWAVFNFPHRRKAIEPQSAQTTDTTPDIAAMTANSAKRQTTTLPEQWGRDPFAHGGAQTTTTSEEIAPLFRLAAISVADGKALAMINGRMLGRGDTVDGWRVAAISSSSVALESNGRKVTLKIGGE